VIAHASREQCCDSNPSFPQASSILHSFDSDRDGLVSLAELRKGYSRIVGTRRLICASHPPRYVLIPLDTFLLCVSHRAAATV
jgi:hypothetical protein